MTERILVSLLVAVAILAAIPQAMFLPWGIVLVLLGLIAGAMWKSGDATDRSYLCRCLRTTNILQQFGCHSDNRALG